MILYGRGSSDPASADEDFLVLIDQAESDERSVGLPIVRQELFATDERLDGVVEVTGDPATFAAALGLCRYDRRSPWMWCASAGDEVVASDGIDAAPLEGCVAWDRKRTRQFRRWKAGETIVGAPRPVPAVVVVVSRLAVAGTGATPGFVACVAGVLGALPFPAEARGTELRWALALAP